MLGWLDENFPIFLPFFPIQQTMTHYSITTRTHTSPFASYYTPPQFPSFHIALYTHIIIFTQPYQHTTKKDHEKNFTKNSEQTKIATTHHHLSFCDPHLPLTHNSTLPISICHILTAYQYIILEPG